MTQRNNLQVNLSSAFLSIFSLADENNDVTGGHLDGAHNLSGGNVHTGEMWTMHSGIYSNDNEVFNSLEVEGSNLKWVTEGGLIELSCRQGVQ